MSTPVWVFGNPDLEIDALPIALMPEFERRYPHLAFSVHDPNEDFDMPEHLLIIDTVQGIDRVTTFDSIEAFADTPHVTMHDFDLGMKLKWLAKLKKLPPFTLIGVPMGGERELVLAQLEPILGRR